jgi:hypothetical protein
MYTSNIDAVALGADIAVTGSVLPNGFPKRYLNESEPDTCINRPIIEGDYAETQCPNDSAASLNGGTGTKALDLLYWLLWYFKLRAMLTWALWVGNTISWMLAFGLLTPSLMFACSVSCAGMFSMFVAERWLVGWRLKTGTLRMLIFSS